MTDPILPTGIERVLVPQETIESRVEALAHEIAADFAADCKDDNELLVLGVLNGSLIFLADLVRRLPLRVRYDMIHASSYVGTTRTDDLKIGPLPARDSIEGAQVLLVDDILDSGRTLQAIRNKLQALNPARLRTAALLRKETPRADDIDVDYAGFDIGEGFVVGYGLDVDGRFRDLPYIALYAG